MFELPTVLLIGQPIVKCYIKFEKKWAAHALWASNVAPMGRYTIIS